MYYTSTAPRKNMECKNMDGIHLENKNMERKQLDKLQIWTIKVLMVHNNWYKFGPYNLEILSP